MSKFLLGELLHPKKLSTLVEALKKYFFSVMNLFWKDIGTRTLVKSGYWLFFLFHYPDVKGNSKYAMEFHPSKLKDHYLLECVRNRLKAFCCFECIAYLCGFSKVDLTCSIKIIHAHLKKYLESSFTLGCISNISVYYPFLFLQFIMDFIRVSDNSNFYWCL